MAELARRTTELADHLRQLEQKQNETVDLGAAILQLEERLATTARHLREMDHRVNTVSRKLQDTPSYGVRGDFKCDSCGSKGFAAVPLKCTSCGKEGWWGWWPK